MTVFLIGGMLKMCECQGPVGEPRVEMFTCGHLKKGSCQQGRGSISKRLWGISLGLAADKGQEWLAKGETLLH